MTERAFAKLLAAFDAEDEQRAALEYEAARERLVKLFRWRKLAEAEDAADETLNRVARRLDEGEQIENLSAFIGGVARFVLLEKFKQRERVALEDVAPEILSENPKEFEETENEQKLVCFKRCLNELPEDTRRIVVEYYEADAGGAKIDHRKQMAARLGLEMNALRNRALRARTRLEDCIKKCLGG